MTLIGSRVFEGACSVCSESFRPIFLSGQSVKMGGEGFEPPTYWV